MHEEECIGLKNKIIDIYRAHSVSTWIYIPSKPVERTL